VFRLRSVPVLSHIFDIIVRSIVLLTFLLTYLLNYLLTYLLTHSLHTAQTFFRN